MADIPKRDNTTPSCAVCQRRKVKCDRVHPCAPCRKTGLVCEFKQAAPRHRSKRVKRDGDGRGVVGSDGKKGGSRSSRGGPRLVSDGAGLRYVNNHLWNAITPQTDGRRNSNASVGEDGTPRTRATPQDRSGAAIYESVVQQGSEIAAGYHGSSERQRSFLFGNYEPHGQGDIGTTSARPSPSQTIQLWQTCLANVDPLLKVFHAPTVQQLVLGQIGKPEVTVDEQALLSAIYFISVVTLQDDECDVLLHEIRSDLLVRFRRATEDALSAAGFVTTASIMVLQAFVLYLTALRSLGETETVWTMNGLAIRIAGSMGLARDGSVLNLSPFESEIRRRLWWFMVYLDARTGELVGQDGDLLIQKYDVRPPSKLSDSELFEGMHCLRDAKAVSSDIVYVQFRVTLATCLRSIPGGVGPASTWQRMRAAGVPMVEKISIIETLEKTFDDAILQYCNPTVPLQLFTMNAVQTYLAKMRLVGKVPIVSGSEEAQSEEDEKYSENTFQLSLRIMQLQLQLWSEPSLQKWRWISRGHFQWYAMVELLRHTRLRPARTTTTQAWSVIRSVFDTIIPTLELGPKQSLLLDSIRALFRAASSSRPDGGLENINAQPTPEDSERGNPTHSPPRVASADLRSAPSYHYLGSTPHSACLPGMGETSMAATEQGDLSFPTPHTPNYPGFDLESIDWEEFDRLTAELCGQ